MIRTIGPSRSSNASSLMIAAISPARPPVRECSCRMMTLLVFSTSRDGFAIKRRNRAQVHDFDLDSLFAQQFSRFERRVHHGRISDYAEIAAFTGDARLAERNDVIFRRNFFFDTAIEIFVLEENNGIVVADRGFDQSLCVVGALPDRRLSSRECDEPHFGIL